VTQRDVSPQRLVHYRNTWYLDAWCHQKEQLLRFALDAVEQASILKLKAREVPVKTVEAALDAGYGIFAGARAQWATLAFSAEAARWVGREEWHPRQKTRYLPDGRFEMRVPYANETELVMDVLRHGGEVAVLAPESLRAAVQAQLKAALKSHAVA
jgi:predicted DNA-binding transcriptional regulator YafY